MENCSTAVIYHEMYNGRGFSRLEHSWERYRAGLDTFARLGFIAPGVIPNETDTSDIGRFIHPGDPAHGFLPVYRAPQASDEELCTVHSLEHIEHVYAMDAVGTGFFDRNDTPAWNGVFRRAALAFGGTLLAADLVATGEAQHVFHVAGGLHHAHRERVSGFCIFNDIVGAVRRWQTRYDYRRIAVLDVDGHHGDGTQSLLYDEAVLTVSLHMYDGRFFPRTGAADERGNGAGDGYNLNLPLARNSTDADYLPLLDRAFARIEEYEPQAIILQYGVDGHKADRMVGIQLSTYVYEEVAERVHALAHRVCGGRLVAVSGGGYVPDSVARCWAILLANLSGRRYKMGNTYHNLHDAV
jgi:acetoin utilization protein AcuC